MTTKTDRILSYLPGTFQALPRPTALYSLADAFGGELLLAENFLSEVMAAHWVDHADRGLELIRDLAQMADLYGLAPRPDESIEEFRAHLIRYICIFLEGTTTIQGVLRVAAEALSLPIADAYDAMDTWWQRSGDEWVSHAQRRDDAASVLLGIPAATALGADAQPAQFTSTTTLAGSLQYDPGAKLRLAVNGQNAADVDLADATTITEIIDAINTAGFGSIATQARFSIQLASPTVGPTSKLDIFEVDGDVAPAVLGLAPRSYRSSAIRTAQVTGLVDLGDGVDLVEKRFLRIFVDGTLLQEVDCAGANPENTGIDQIRDAINDALGFTLASHDGHFLTLTSPTSGASGSIAFLNPAAQDAAALLFGALEPIYRGEDKTPARFIGTHHLNDGVDLSQVSKIRLKLDGGQPITMDCAGADPGRTRGDEIVATINGVIGQRVARMRDGFLQITSPEEIIFQTPAEADATATIFGLAPRHYRGQAAKPAQILGAVDLKDGINLWARSRIRLALNDGNPVTVNLRLGAPDPANASLDDIVATINGALGQSVANHDGEQLILRTPSKGQNSRLQVLAMKRKRKTRFTTRALITEEASQTVLGTVAKVATGKPAKTARIVGTADLSRGVDLRRDGYLHLAIDGAPSVEFNCAGKRPRATTVEEIAEKIGEATAAIATVEGRHLRIESPTSGTAGSIAFLPVLAHDGLSQLLGLPPGTHRGRQGTRVMYTSTVNLGTDPIELPENAALKLAVDDSELIEIALGDGSVSLNAVANKINAGLGFVAATEDGTRLILASSRPGLDSRLEFGEPEGSDVTAMLFGITPPRSYHGEAPVPARVVSQLDTSDGLELSQNLVLPLKINGQDVNIALPENEGDPLPTSFAQVVETINDQAGLELASIEDDRLVLTSPIAGLASRIVLAAHVAGDARQTFFGEVTDTTTGTNALPARIVGERQLLDPVDLSRRDTIRIAIDGSPHHDLAVMGLVPRTTFPDEIVAAINRVFPEMASIDEESRLVLESPTAGEMSQLRLEPLRALELIEYPPVAASVSRQVAHGDSLIIDNLGAAKVLAEVEIYTAHGLAGFSLVNLTSGMRLSLHCTLSPGDTLILGHRDTSGIQATIHAVDGSSREVPNAAIQVEPKGATVSVPRGRSRWLFTSCLAARFNQAHFNENHFPGGMKKTQGVFNVNHFSARPPDPNQAIAAVFAGGPTEPEVQIDFRWQNHLPGSFQLNLPDDLPARFGARFNEGRFGQRGQAAEFYPNTVNEPIDDDDHLVKRLESTSLVVAKVVDVVPLGWVAQVVPFRKPRFLTLGSPEQEAALYLQEEGVPGFIQLKANKKGAWGNLISVVLRKAGPAQFDVTIAFAGAKFENAREVARGEPLQALVTALLAASPVGVLQAKAAGIKSQISRDGVAPNR